ncbi:hypothetical protein DAI22_04g232200 [Oryza sativa Japonica Group]|nr:hypothetical protein DAI22_04g232200 [Oryza sativa Japonica Group]
MRSRASASAGRTSRSRRGRREGGGRCCGGWPHWWRWRMGCGRKGARSGGRRGVEVEEEGGEEGVVELPQDSLLRRRAL